MNQKRIKGDENSLLIAWGFDIPGQGEGPLPAKLNSFWQASQGNGHDSLSPLVSVSSTRNSSDDSKLFDSPSIIALNRADIRLPVFYGKRYRVVQGYDDNDKDASHNSNGAFCLDITLDEGQAGGTFPAGPVLCPVYNGGSGRAVEYAKGLDPLEKNGLPENYVRIQTAENEFVKYQHFDKDSIPPKIDVGEPYAPEPGIFIIPDNIAPSIDKHYIIGKMGQTIAPKPNNEHVHFGAGSGPLLFGSLRGALSYSMRPLRVSRRKW